MIGDRLLYTVGKVSGDPRWCNKTDMVKSGVQGMGLGRGTYYGHLLPVGRVIASLLAAGMGTGSGHLQLEAAGRETWLCLQAGHKGIYSCLGVVLLVVPVGAAAAAAAAAVWPAVYRVRLPAQVRGDCREKQPLNLTLYWVDAGRGSDSSHPQPAHRGRHFSVV